MTAPIDHVHLHRTAKYFMDNGRAETHDAAMAMLRQYGLTVYVAPSITEDACEQIALLTLVNVARRTLLGGVEVIGLPDCASLTALAPDRTLREAVAELGGVLAGVPQNEWPCAVIGESQLEEAPRVGWRLVWEGWRGGVVPLEVPHALSGRTSVALAPALAAAACAAEAFAYHAADHLLAGRRAVGMSLWNPAADWLQPDAGEPDTSYLPSRLWFIGLGNLGQAFAWLLAALPYRRDHDVQVVLQDFDDIAPSNDSTSLLSFTRDIGRRKARTVAEWLETRGFKTFVNERPFGPHIRRSDSEPAVALCGVDNALARAALEEGGFGLIVEAGLGAGPEAFRSLALHTFPASRRAADIWSKQVGDATSDDIEQKPAYRKLKEEGMDACGLTQLASRTVGVPFVGLIAGCLVIAELLRRLHGGSAVEFLSGSVAALEDVELGLGSIAPYAFGHVHISQ